MKIFIIILINIQIIFQIKSEMNSKKLILKTKSTSLKNYNNDNLTAIQKIRESSYPLYFDPQKFIGTIKATSTLILSGLFDRSFFITTLMAIKYPKILVLISASISLTFIGFIAVYLGMTINKYIPVLWIDSIAVLLFILFGTHMIYDGYHIDEKSQNEKLDIETNINNPYNEEKNFVKSEEILTTETIPEEKEIFNLENQEKNYDQIFNEEIKPFNNLIETKNENLIMLKNKEIQSEPIENIKNENKTNFFIQWLNNESLKIFVKVFVLIFFSEIGDRSQISTIYLTTNFEKIIVLLSVVYSSIILSILAVFGGKLISNKISERNLTILAGASFLLFGVIALVMLFIEQK